jgi:hypothetical protein
MNMAYRNSSHLFYILAKVHHLCLILNIGQLAQSSAMRLYCMPPIIRRVQFQSATDQSVTDKSEADCLAADSVAFEIVNQ